MKLLNLSIILYFGIFGTIFPSHQASERPVIDSPSEGDVLRGVVTVSGSADILGFQSAEVLFGYEGDPTETWFFIREHNSVIKSGTLATWDTNVITDGNYRLLLRVYVEDGPPVDTIISGLRIRNYTIAETSTPGPPVEATDTGDASILGEMGEELVPTALPSNPAQVTLGSLFLSILKGMGYTVLGLALIGALFYLRNRYINR